MTPVPPKPLTITGRILGYPSPNMLIEGKKPIFIQDPAQREKVAADFPVGTIVTIQTENGTLKGDPVVATGPELEKFEKREERKREQAGKSAIPKQKAPEGKFYSPTSGINNDNPEFKESIEESELSSVPNRIKKEPIIITSGEYRADSGHLYHLLFDLIGEDFVTSHRLDESIMEVFDQWESKSITCPAINVLICPRMSTTSLTPTPCQKQNCRIFVSCWIKEAEAMRALGLDEEAAGIEGEIRKIIGGKME